MMHSIAILQSPVYPVQMYRAYIYRFFRIISYYARKYFVPKYISQPRPSQRPQSRGNTLEPGDGHRTIPSNGGGTPY